MGKPAPKGNKYATKLKDPEQRKEAYIQYCDHIAKGLSKESWYYFNENDPLKSICYKTMETYMEQNPTDFPPILMEMAQSKSFAVFEQEGFKLMKGQYRHGSPVVWQTFMRNKFKWDKEQLEANGKCAADVMLEKILEMAPDKKKHYGKGK